MWTVKCGQVVKFKRMNIQELDLQHAVTPLNNPSVYASILGLGVCHAIQLPQRTKEAIRLYVDDYIQTQWMPLFTETVMPNSGMVPVYYTIPKHRW